jgi:hypothetical protein
MKISRIHRNRHIAFRVLHPKIQVRGVVFTPYKNRFVMPLTVSYVQSE